MGMHYENKPREKKKRIVIEQDNFSKEIDAAIEGILNPIKKSGDSIKIIYSDKNKI